MSDANTSERPRVPETSGCGIPVPLRVVAMTDPRGMAIAVGPHNPMPVVNTAAVMASDGSGCVLAGGSAQTLFWGIVPANGFLVQNNSSAVLWISDVGTAEPGGASIQLAPGGIFTTPSGYKPPGPVSLYGETTGQAFAARRW